MIFFRPLIPIFPRVITELSDQFFTSCCSTLVADVRPSATTDLLSPLSTSVSSSPLTRPEQHGVTRVDRGGAHTCRLCTHHVEYCARDNLHKHGPATKLWSALAIPLADLLSDRAVGFVEPSRTMGAALLLCFFFLYSLPLSTQWTKVVGLIHPWTYGDIHHL
jgi:hypothetical protein